MRELSIRWRKPMRYGRRRGFDAYVERPADGSRTLVLTIPRLVVRVTTS